MNEINPDHAKAFEEMFGPEAKGENVTIRDPKVQQKINELGTPIPLKLCNSFFKLVLTIFTKLLPCVVIGSLIAKEIFNNNFDFSSFSNSFTIILKYIFPKIIYMCITTGLLWIIIQTLNYFVQFFIVKYYDIKLKKYIKSVTINEKKIKEKLNTIDNNRDTNQNSQTFDGYTKDEIVSHAKEAVDRFKNKQDKNSDKK
jgi:hypothetical protein